MYCRGTPVPKQDAAGSSWGQLRGGRTSRHRYYGMTTAARFSAGRPQQDITLMEAETIELQGGRPQQVILQAGQLLHGRRSRQEIFQPRPQPARDVARQSPQQEILQGRRPQQLELQGRKPQQIKLRCKDEDHSSRKTARTKTVVAKKITGTKITARKIARTKTTAI